MDARIKELWDKRLAVAMDPTFLGALIRYRRRTWQERWFTLPWRPWVKYVAKIPMQKGDKVKINMSLVPDTQHIIQQEATGFERKLLSPRVKSTGYVKIAGWKPHGPAPCTDMMIEGSEDWLPDTTDEESAG